jgi:hypothetical protein
MMDRDVILYGKGASRPLEKGENLKVSTPKSLSAGSKKSGRKQLKSLNHYENAGASLAPLLEPMPWSLDTPIWISAHPVLGITHRWHKPPLREPFLLITTPINFKSAKGGLCVDAICCLIASLPQCPLPLYFDVQPLPKHLECRCFMAW